MYDQFLVDKTHPILKNHKAYGQELLPGLAYIDVLYQMFREHGYDYRELVLRNVAINHPLLIEQDYQVMLSIQATEEQEGQWQLRVEGQQQRHGLLNEAKILYLTAEMHHESVPRLAERLDMQQVKLAARKVTGMYEMYEQCRRQQLVHSGFMQATGAIYDEADGAIIDIALGQKARASANEFMFHPTLIDGSGIGSMMLFATLVENEQQLFLPLFYESFQASALLQERCITRVQTASVRRKNELMYMTMEFFNEEGEKVAELKNYVGKLVRDARQINRQQEDAAPVALSSGHVSQPAFLQANNANGAASVPAKDAIYSIELFLRQVLAEHLGRPLDQIGTRIGYYEMGLNSVGLLEVVKALGSKIGVSLTPTLFFEYPTITELATYLAEQYSSYFSQGASVAYEENTSLVRNESTQSAAVPEERAHAVEVPAEVILHPAEVARRPESEKDDIAIVGMSGRYPGAKNLDEFWKNLKEGKDCITEIPLSRWDWRELQGITSPSGKDMSRWGGFIDEPDCFDPQFFRISPREAETMDPQERLFLEICWEAIEDAGYTPDTLVVPRGVNRRRAIGVFVGVMHKDYTLIGANALAQGEMFPLALNNAPIANRVSYFCNFHGPSMAIDTVCSSSLTAVHQALESIKHGECEVALAGGVNLSLHPNKYLSYGLVDMHASDGYCHTFGKGGDGYVSGEGVGVVVLKSLRQALQDGDHIYAVIKGSTVNHSGAVSGITVPSPVAQADAIMACLEKTGLDARTISYIEAHGTGTSLGDPIEMQGLVKTFRHYTPDQQFCSIGSVKSNIGHAESAAGISGLQKVILQLYHKTLVASLHSEELNPLIDFQQSPFYVQHRTEAWQRPQRQEDGKTVSYLRRAGVSSFGATGSNAHLILEEYVPSVAPRWTHNGHRPVLIPLSAKNKERLGVQARQLAQFLTKRFASVQPALHGEESSKMQRKLLEVKIRTILSALLHVDEEGVDRGQEWIEYGLEPVHLSQIQEKIHEELGVEIDVAELSPASSIDSVVAYLLQKPAAIASLQEKPGQVGLPPADENEVYLHNLAYTLQVGRAEMEERVVMVVQDVFELIGHLESVNSRTEMANKRWYGQIRPIHQDATDFLNRDQDFQRLIHEWIARGDVAKVAELWAKGYEIDWVQLHNGEKLQRIPLPTYPFAREHYWLPVNKSYPSAAITPPATIVAATIHPLLQRNTSDFSTQRFSSIFTGQEFFLTDHIVRGQRILPGVVYLEMARAAVAQAVGSLVEGEYGMHLKNTIWASPIVVGEQPVHVHIELQVETGEAISYEIYSASATDTATEPVIHCQGSVELSPIMAVHALDLATLQEQCQQSSLTAQQCYAAFHALGIDYGPAHKGIEQLYIGSGQVLARLHLPSSVATTQSQYVLHPSIMDAALQATMGLMAGESADVSLPQKSSLPFALERLEVHDRCSASMWAWVRFSADSQPGDKIQKVDVDLCDDAGSICVSMRHFTTRELDGELQVGQETSSGNVLEPPIGTSQLSSQWDVVQPEKGALFPSPSEHIVLVGGSAQQRLMVQQLYPQVQALEIGPQDAIADIVKKLQNSTSIEHIVWIAPPPAASSLVAEMLIAEQKLGVWHCFHLIKALLQSGYGNKNIGWSVITTQAQPIQNNEDVNPTHTSIHGLIGVMAKEYPAWKVRLVDLEVGRDWPLETMFTLPRDRQGRAWVYRGQQWYRQQLLPVQAIPVKQTAYRMKGVYVVIGGAGNVGAAWSEYMLRTYHAQIVWIGRRQKDLALQGKLDRLAAFGAAPYYIAADATDQVALQQAYVEVKERFGQIHGVIHSAMVLSDHPLAEMQEEQFQTVFNAKVAVSIRIAQIFQPEQLDFILFFSSLMALTKSPRQSNYAAGCTFADAFAHQLGREWPCAVKVINWGYWNSGEMDATNLQTVQEAYQRLEQIGIGRIESAEAMATLEGLLASPLDQIALIKTTRSIVLEGMALEEQLTVYPDQLPEVAHSLKSHITTQDAHIQLLKERLGRPREEMDALLCQLLWMQLRALGLFCTPSSTRADLLAQGQLQGRYERWLDESLALLIYQQYLIFDGSVYVVRDPALIEREALWSMWEQKKVQWLREPDLRAQVLLVEATLRVLPDILTGKVPATDILFPNSSMYLVEGIYKESQIVDYFNEVLADSVVVYVQERLQRDPSARLHILEIGAGTGGTSAMVFRKLQPYQHAIEEYCYTDLSKAFLSHAEQAYGAQNPYLTYHIFNVEEPLNGQEIQTGTYDLVIAANVLHATRNIRQTLRNAKATLQRNGLLLLNEMSAKNIFLHLTFGLVDGWWLYEDAALRMPGCPGLAPSTWQSVLENEGFRAIFFPTQAQNDLGQQIIVAASDGVVRQRKRSETKKQPVLSSPEKIALSRTAKSQPAPKRQVAAEKVAVGSIRESLREKSLSYLKHVLSETLRLPYQEINVSTPLDKYGIDSIIIVQLTNVLRKDFSNDISSTLFFEYQTIEMLADYLLLTQKDALIKLVGWKDTSDALAETTIERASQPIAFSVRKTSRFSLHSDKEQSVPAGSLQDIAIVGLAGRYPQADSLQAFWSNLKEGRNCISEIPKERWDWKTYFAAEKGKWGTMYSRWGGFLSEIDTFDPLFFQISPKEAEQMDPQERLFLQCAYASIQDAGYTPATLAPNQKVGVFVGVMNGNYASGARYWSIANRLSYLLNLQGPSLAVDTACSSSLTAIHLALESLYSGTSDCAIAGGVNLIVDPIHYIKLSGATMLSEGDQCRSFGEQADGFVDGEAVGALVLKPLARAVAAGDHIYGVIKGSMLNAGGKTNGYTVPNPIAQARVIADALQRSGVHPRTISYLEAHGTGTALGDPIEIAALTRAFEQQTQERGYCAIGSAKSNVGHCESAAGIVGITKVLLQMQHGQLAPSLHAERPNPQIEFGRTPFVLQQELGEWKRPIVELEGEQREYPRRAGISSFGAGGANAHVIIEEYIPVSVEPAAGDLPERLPALIVLSAKNEARLRAQVEQLLQALQEQSWHDTDLAAIAYTLQVGREAMEARVGMLVHSLPDLQEKLQGFLQGRVYDTDLYHGGVKGNRETIALFADEDMEQTLDAWVGRRKYGKILELWVKGLAFDWNKLYGEMKLRRISLPTYPFARERYWEILPSRSASDESSSGIADGIHPLVQKNTSHFYAQRFSSTFGGKEPFLIGHPTHEQRTLPGVAYLEMARVAIEQAMEDLEDDLTGLQCSDIVALTPLVVADTAVQVHIALSLDEHEQITFEVYSGAEDDQYEPVVYCQGSASLGMIAGIPHLDLLAVQDQCRQTISASVCYEALKAVGIIPGPGDQRIEKVYVGQDQVLVQVSSTESDSKMQTPFVIHPILLESVLRVAVGVLESSIADVQGSIIVLAPAEQTFTLDKLEVLKPCTATRWVLLRYSDNHEAESLAAFDIDMSDYSGAVCLRLRGYAPYAPQSDDELEEFAAEIAMRPLQGAVMLTPVWGSVALPRGSAWPAPSENILLVSVDAEYKQRIQSHYPAVHVLDIQSQESTQSIVHQLESYSFIEHIIWVASSHLTRSLSDEAVIAEQEEGVLCLFRLLKALLKQGYGERRLSWSVLTVQTQSIQRGEQVDPTHASLHGFVGSMAKEYPSWSVRLVDLPAQGNWPLAALFTIPADPHGNAWAYREQEWYRLQLLSVQRPPLEQSKYRQGGVYVVIGGAGGIGETWSEYMIRTYQAHIIWIGRRPQDEAIQAKIERLAQLGPAPYYIAADATDRQALQQAYTQIKQQHKRIYGVVHSAILLLDKSLANMDEERFRAGLSAKVDICGRLVQVFGLEMLDFVIFFSSINSFFKSPGQSNYAAGCTFKDAFAGQLEQEWPGVSKTMNWGYWGSVGIVSTQAYQEGMAQAGIGSIEPAEGMDALEALLAGSFQQVSFLKTTRSLSIEGINNTETVTLYASSRNANIDAIKQQIQLASAAREIPTGKNAENAVPSMRPLSDIQAAVLETASRILKVKVEDIDIDVELHEYGFDPVRLTEFTTQLSQDYAFDLDAEMIVDCPTLNTIAERIVGRDNKNKSLLR